MNMKEWVELGNHVKKAYNMVVFVEKTPQTKKKWMKANKLLIDLKSVLDDIIFVDEPRDFYEYDLRYPDDLMNVFYGPTDLSEILEGKKISGWQGWVCRTCGQEGTGLPPIQCFMCGKSQFIEKGEENE